MDVATRDLGLLLQHTLRIFLRHVEEESTLSRAESCRQSVQKAGELLEALHVDFGSASEVFSPAERPGTGGSGGNGATEDLREPERAETWSLQLRGLQGQSSELRKLPCEITFGELHQKVREATGAIDEGCDVQLMLGNTILHHGRAVVLKDMARCDGMELTYIFQPVEPPLSVVRITGHWTDHHPQHENRAWTEYTTTYNKHRRSVHWAIRASVAREERLAALISPEGVFWNLICMGSRPRRSDEQADAKWGVELKRDLYAKSNVFEGLGTNTSLG